MKERLVDLAQLADRQVRGRVRPAGGRARDRDQLVLARLLLQRQQAGAHPGAAGEAKALARAIDQTFVDDADRLGSMHGQGSHRVAPDRAARSPTRQRQYLDARATPTVDLHGQTASQPAAASATGRGLRKSRRSRRFSGRARGHVRRSDSDGVATGDEVLLGSTFSLASNYGGGVVVASSTGSRERPSRN